MKINLILSTFILTSTTLSAQDILVEANKETSLTTEYPLSSQAHGLDADSALALDRIPGITMGRKG